MDKVDFNELVVDTDVVAPSPLDPLIASLFLRTKSNRVTEGYDLSVSAFFGSERVKLTGEDFSVNVEISMARAQIELEFLRCVPSLIETNNGEFSDEWQIEQKRTATRHKKRRSQMLLKGLFSDGLRGSGSAELDYEATKSNDAEVELSRRRKNWKQIRPNTILVGLVVGELEGNEIEEFEGWRVIPDDTSVASGVVATLSVRENWINLIEIDSDSFTGRIGQKAKDLFRTDDKRRQLLFGLLLRHLSTIGLSHPNHPDQAVLAVEHFVVRPEIENATSTKSAPATGAVQLDSMRIDQFLSSSPGSEVETLIAIGVAHQDIREHASQPKPKSGLFIGMSSPIRALEAYKIVCERKSIPRSELDKMVEGRVAQDLINLSLLKTKNGMLYLSSDNGKNPEDMLRYAAARAETVMTTRAILMNESSASNEEIAEMLITKFGKKYSTDASKVRVGNALMRWARWLEPHLIDPRSIEGAKLKASALDTSFSLGPPSMATPENLAIAKAAIAAGESYKSVGDKLGLSGQTISRWKKLGALD